MTDLRCRRCGSELREPQPAGLCERCAEDATRELRRPQPAQETRAPAAEQATERTTEVPDELGSVKLLDIVGSGASGVVYRGHDRVLNRPVAVKFLNQLGGGGSTAQQRFLDEARAGAAVRHPNLVEIYQAGMSGRTPYLILQFVDGQTLAHVLRQHGPLKLGMVAAILSETAMAVDELHRHGIIHRDLKPSNILVDAEGHVHVSDLGVSLRRIRMTGVSEASFAGTPAYMAPELFDGRASPRGDIYGMGVTLFELLEGKPPFDGDMEQVARKHANDAPPTDLLAARGIPSAVIDIIERAMRKQPLFRYKSAEDLSRAFIQAAGVDADRGRRELAALLAGTSTSAATAGRSPELPHDSTLFGTVARIAESKRQKRMADEMSVPLPLPKLRQSECVPYAGAVDDSQEGLSDTAPFASRTAVPCLSCGYDLRGGFAPDGRCPECGTHVARSLDTSRTVFADPMWLRKVGAGIALTMLTPLLIVVAVALNGALRHYVIGADIDRIPARVARSMMYRDFAPGTFRSGMNDAAFGLESFLCLLPLAMGVWLVTRPRGNRSLNAAAGICRAALLAVVGLPLLLALASVLGFSAFGWIAVPGYGLGPNAHRQFGFSAILANIDLMAPIALLWYVGRLARSLPEPVSVRRVRRAAILLIAIASIFVAIDNIGPARRTGSGMVLSAPGFLAAFAVLGAMILFPLALLVSSRLFQQLAARRESGA